MSWFLSFLTLSGFSFAFWGTVGLIRFCAETFARSRGIPNREAKNDPFNLIPLDYFFSRSRRNAADAVLLLDSSLAASEHLKHDAPNLFKNSRFASVSRRKIGGGSGENYVAWPECQSLSALAFVFLKQHRPHLLRNPLRQVLLTGMAHAANISEDSGIPQVLSAVIREVVSSIPPQERRAALATAELTPPVTKLISEAPRSGEVITFPDARWLTNFLERSDRIMLVIRDGNDWDTIGAATAFAGVAHAAGRSVALLAPPDLSALPLFFSEALQKELPAPPERHSRSVHLQIKTLSALGHDSRIAEFDVAAVIPAHNEELSLRDTVRALAHNILPRHIYVASDASTDRTIILARELGCNVLDIQPNRGKAGALTAIIRHFNLLHRYQAILFVDADSEVSSRYLKNALPYFDNPRVAAVAGHLKTRWRPKLRPNWSTFISAYRLRLYAILQAVVRYGQTWKFTNVTSIVPGFASMYRTGALHSIDIQAPGLIIEDFNMTFELHRKNLGVVAYHPRVFGTTDDPHNFHDYRRQVRRWNLGFWQTVRRHGFWSGFFWLSLILFLSEMIIYAAFLALIPLVIGWFFVNGFQPIPVPVLGAISTISELRPLDVLFGVFITDYFISAVVALVQKKPLLFLYGLGFFFLRYVDAVTFLYTLPLAFFEKSEGKWASPSRN